MKLRIQDKKCEACGSYYDPTHSHCPNCKCENSDFSRKLYPVNESAPVLKQILFFVIGSFGFQLIGTLISAIIGTKIDSESLLYKTVVNYSAYGILFIILVLLVWSYWKTIAKAFKNKRTYIGFAIGIGLIAFNLAYSNILAIAGVESNANQQDLVEMVKSSKALGILLIGITGPICEEITYRLGLFDFLKRIHIALAYVACAIFFGFIHFDFTNASSVSEWINIPNYVICGAILCLANDRFGIGASMIAHIMNNVASLILILV